MPKSSTKVPDKGTLVGARIRQVRLSIGKSIEDFAPEVQVASRTLAMYERGERLPDVEFLSRLSTFTGTDFLDLVRLRLNDSGDEKALSGHHNPTERLALAATDAAFVTVRFYDIRAAAGAGALVEREKVETEVAFRADWLHSLGVSPERLAVIYAVGNSMEPIIRHGDALLLELEPDHLIEGGIYVIARDGELMIKRPQKLGAKGLVLLSDNPDYQPVTYPAEEAAAMRIVGRVRWIGRVV